MKKYIWASSATILIAAPTVYSVAVAETPTDVAVALMLPLVVLTTWLVAGRQLVDRMQETTERAVLLRWLRDMGWSAARKSDEGFAGWCIGLARHIEQGAHHAYAEALAEVAKAEPPSQAEVEAAGKDGGA